MLKLAAAVGADPAELPALLAKLDPRDRRVLKARYAETPVTQRELAEEMGIAISRVGQIEAQALRRAGKSLTAMRLAEEYRKKPLDAPAAMLDLPPRAANCLQYEGITTIRELVQRTEGEMMHLPNCGRTSLEEIKAELAKFGLELKKRATRREKAERRAEHAEGCDANDTAAT